MSEQNFGIVKAAFDAWLRGDIDSMLELVDPEIVVVQSPDLPDAVTQHGRAGVLAAIAAWAEEWDDFEIEIGRGKGSGVAVEGETWFVFGFRNGRVAEWRMFGREREALQAAGLEE